jgi:hypothetical protein
MLCKLSYKRGDKTNELFRTLFMHGNGTTITDMITDYYVVKYMCIRIQLYQRQPAATKFSTDPPRLPLCTRRPLRQQSGPSPTMVTPPGFYN